jgi:hypothetical protein
MHGLVVETLRENTAREGPKQSAAPKLYIPIAIMPKLGKFHPNREWYLATSNMHIGYQHFVAFYFMDYRFLVYGL